MNQNILLIGLLIGALFFFRRPAGSAAQNLPWIERQEWDLDIGI